MIGKQNTSQLKDMRYRKQQRKHKKATAVAAANEHQYVDALQQLSQSSIPSNQNPLKKLEMIDKPLTIKQDQESKQVINTIRETPPKMYTPPHLLIDASRQAIIIQKTYSQIKGN